MQKILQPGQLLARGVSRHFHELNFASLTEFVPTRGLRVDVVAIGPKGEIWVVECKSSRADFQGDHKWEGYLEWCDRFFWCVDENFPDDLLPENMGKIVADGFGAEILAYGPEYQLAASRRKVLTRKIARTAMSRFQAHVDPTPALRHELVETL